VTVGRLTDTTTVLRLDADSATQAWDLISQRADALIARWEENAAPPPLAEFLPEGPQALRHLTLVELIKVDLEYRWQEYSFPRTLAEYLEEFPELATGAGVPAHLIYEEFHIRKQAGDEVDVQVYLEMFPQQADELGRLLGLEAPHLTTSLVGGHRLGEIDVGHSIDEFNLLKQLGKGAFATVFLAWQTTMQRFVALKVSSDQGAEPQTLAQLEHDHIVRVYDQKVLRDRRLRLLYMQHIAGGTLQQVADIVKRTPPEQRSGRMLLESVDRAVELSGKQRAADSWTRRRLEAANWPTVVCWLGAQLANALDYSHRRNVLHRDIKPANVLLTEDGSPKLADFNISYSSQVQGVTPAAYFGGSLPYMSTEQLEACHPALPRQPDELDGRSDTYSLGIMLWELLTGHRPYDDALTDAGWTETLEKMLERRRAGVPREAIERLPADCLCGLDEVLLTCLAADRDNRFANAGQLARQLELCLKPRIQDLFRPKRAPWRQTVRRYALPALALAALVPNAICSALNITFNLNTFFDRPEYNQLADDFWGTMVPVVNTIVYPIGIAILCYLAWPVCRYLAQSGHGPPSDSTQPVSMRRRCLELGEYVAAVTFYGWMTTGLILPLWINAADARPGFSWQVLLVFLMSHALCGLIAATMSFFFVTFLAVRCLYPPLAQAQLEESAAAADLSRLGRRIAYYFGGAVLAPVLSIIFLAIGSFHQHFSLIMGVMGLVGFAVAYQMAKVIQGDISALLQAVLPSGTMLGAESETVDSFWASTR
jgi:serine/threonine protein kinase